MNYKLLVFLLVLQVSFGVASIHAQVYTVANAHSHNDYANHTPFYLAFDKGFASIEADIFPVNGELLVAHDSVELGTARSLSAMYLEPAGRLLKGSSRQLQLLIDIKKDYPEALKLLIKQLKPYRSLLSAPGRPAGLTVVISGERPAPSLFYKYPDYIWFDGNFKFEYSPGQWKRVALVSFSFTDFSKWNGVGSPAEGDRARLKAVIDKAHKSQKKIRFWAAPDTATSWMEQMKLGADFIGTDRIEELAIFLKSLPEDKPVR